MMTKLPQMKGLDLIPTDIARHMVELAEIKEGQRILELSAGTVNLLKAILAEGTCGYNVGVNVCSKPGKSGRDPKNCRCCGTGTLQAIRSKLEIVAVDRSLELKGVLASIAPWATIITADFLSCAGDLGKFDRIVMAPPFENSIEHIQHALTFLAPEGRLVALCVNGPQTLFDQADYREFLQAEEFEAAENVNAALIRMTNRGDRRVWRG